MPVSELEILEMVNHFGSNVVSHEITLASEFLGFQGTYYNFTIFFNNRETRKYFIKSTPSGNTIVNNFHHALGTLIKEVDIYKKIFPLMKNCTNRKLWPECHLAKIGKYIVLENMNTSGWINPPNMNSDHINVTLMGLAEFHAASLCFYEDTNFVHLVTTTLTESMFSTNVKHPGRMMWDSFCNLVQHIIGVYLPHRNVNVNKIMQEVIHVVKPSTVFRNCVNHGDPWMNNIFFYYNNNVPTYASFVDYQSARYAPPALDVMIFLNIFAPDNLEGLAQSYYEKLVDALQKINAKTLSEEEFEKSLHCYKGPGITIAALYIFLTKLPARYLSTILISQETFIPFALGHDYSPALKALEEDFGYRGAVIQSLERMIRYYSEL